LVGRLGQCVTPTHLKARGAGMWGWRSSVRRIAVGCQARCSHSALRSIGRRVRPPHGLEAGKNGPNVSRDCTAAVGEPLLCFVPGLDSLRLIADELDDANVM
jgi:hypothetical protein